MIESKTGDRDMEPYESAIVVDMDSVCDEINKTEVLFLDDTECSSIPSADAVEVSIVETDDDKNRRRIKWRRQLIFAFGCILVLLLLLVSTLFIGARIEARAIARAPSTLSLYTDNDNLCVASGGDLLNTFTANTTDALVQEDAVAHCGSCGQCSNLNDLEVLSKTRKTLTKESTKCAFRMFLSKRAVEKCMENNVGFTSSCNDCWVDNIQCTFKRCKYTCIKSKLFSDSLNEGSEGELNDCLKCDETMCGPEFLSCSGANRRRMGITSDIGRDANHEQCNRTDIDWASLHPIRS